MNLLRFSVVALGLSPVLFPSASHGMDIQGKVALWERNNCRTAMDCDLPRPIGVEWSVNLKIPEPTPDSPIQAVMHRYEQGYWSLLLSFYRVLPPEGSDEVEYVVTQSRLEHQKLGLVAECSRYDSAATFTHFPVGSCSGPANGKQVGVTFLKAAKP